jgi:hypothetical protein
MVVCIKDLTTDLLVVGGGLSGTFAAIAAKRTCPSMTVWLVEQYGFLGGMATAGFVFPMMKYWSKDENQIKRKRLTGGLFREMMHRMHQLGYTEKIPLINDYYTQFENDLLRNILDEMIIEAKVNVLFHGLVNHVETYNKSELVNTNKELTKEVTIVCVQTKLGEIRFHPQALIDASGDADVVFHAGGLWEIGRPEDRLVQPATLNFRVGNLNYFPANRINITNRIRKMKKVGKPLTPRDDCLMFRTIHKSERHFNQTRVAGFDFMDPFQMTQAEIEGRRQTENFIRFLRESVPGFRNCSVQMATQLGIRESRRIIGEYCLTEQDLIDCKQFEDRIALGNYSIDIHDPKGSAKTQIRRIPEGRFYSIPYRCLVPRLLTNILVAGRPISTTHEAHAAIRIMPICSAIGHAAGVAAGLRFTNKNCYSFRELDVKLLQKELRNQNAILE